MVLSDQLVTGMIISVQDNLFRVEGVTKVNMPKGGNLIKVKLRDLSNHTIAEKNFKISQTLEEVDMKESSLEFLYEEGKNYIFLDTNTIDQVVVSKEIIGDKILYLKEGIEVKGMLYDDKVYLIELPQFLELNIAKILEEEDQENITGTRKATLETGAVIEVPPFVEIGDVIRVNPHTEEYVQRV